MDYQIRRKTWTDKVCSLMARMNHFCDDRTQAQPFSNYSAAHCNPETFIWICVF